jgi:hypothetical protein
MTAVLAAHVTAAVLLAALIGRVNGEIGLLATTAVPVSQATLLALWAALSRVRSYVRIPLAIAGLAGVWFVESRSLDWTSDDWRSAAHAGMFAVQATLVFAVAQCAGRWTGRPLRHEGGSPAKMRFQFTLGALLAWAVAIGVLLGLGKAALAGSGWTRDVVSGQLFRHGLVIGVYNASYGLLIAWAVLVRRRRWAWRLPIALVFASLLAWSEGPVLEALCQSNGSVGVLGWIGWSTFQVFYLSASLVFIAISRRDLA